MTMTLTFIEPTDGDIIENLTKEIIRDGEKRLMLAVLESATEDFQKHALASHKRGKELFDQAEAWIFDTDDDSFFSFENICQHLQLDPRYMRQGFIRWKDATRNGAPRKYIKRPNRRAA
jgi:hypothetical protein